MSRGRIVATFRLIVRLNRIRDAGRPCQKQNTVLCGHDLHDSKAECAMSQLPNPASAFPANALVASHAPAGRELGFLVTVLLY